MAEGTLLFELAVTFQEMIVGLFIGVPLGILAGLLSGWYSRIDRVTHHVIIAVYSVPLIALAPVFILWFGVGVTPKIMLVTVVTFFFLFFNTYTGIKTVDANFIHVVKIMGGTEIELFRKVVLPATSVWILTGLRIAIPFSLTAAVAGEMIVARFGLGRIITYAAALGNLTTVYMGLLCLMVLAIFMNEVAGRLESRILRWREATKL